MTDSSFSVAGLKIYVGAQSEKGSTPQVEPYVCVVGILLDDGLFYGKSIKVVGPNSAIDPFEQPWARKFRWLIN